MSARDRPARGPAAKAPDDGPGAQLISWLTAPQPILRLELVRILAPLAILGFMSTRLVHAPDWLGDAGFRVPDLGGPDWRQPLYLAPLPRGGAWLLATALVVSGLMVSLGVRARAAAGVFAACLAYVAVADRLSAFTVSKLAPLIALGLAVSPIGARLGIDAWRRSRTDPSAESPSHVAGAPVRFFQAQLVVLYTGSGICKMRGDWLEHPHLLFTQLHDSYQTPISWAIAGAVPALGWTLMQGGVLAFEALAPLWFGMSRTRRYALVFGLGMHLMIGLMFGPVRWFAMLMASLLVACFLPAEILERWERRLPDRQAEPPSAPTSPRPHAQEPSPGEPPKAKARRRAKGAAPRSPR